MKLLVNLLWFGQAIANAEVLSLAARAGIDPETARHAVQQSAAASRFMENDAPALMRGDNLASFSLARCVEELTGVLTMAGQHDVPLALGERVTEMYAEALQHFGDIDGELLAARRVAEQAKVEFGAHAAARPGRGMHGPTMGVLHVGRLVDAEESEENTQSSKETGHVQQHRPPHR